MPFSPYPQLEVNPFNVLYINIFTRNVHPIAGRITFGPPVGSNSTSFGRTTANMEPVENSELLMLFRTDDPGNDRRLRIWLRADEYRSGNTFVKNGYGIELNTNTNDVRLIQSKDSSEKAFNALDSQAEEWLRQRQ